MTSSDGGDASSAAPSARTNLWASWTRPETRTRRLLVAAGVYLLATAIYAALAGPTRLFEHTPFNHFALLADAWLHGRQDLAHGPPAYTMNNDFVEYGGKTYVSFPPFPAMLMLPFVRLAGSAEDFRDGQFVIWLSGLAPTALFLVLEKLRRSARSARSEIENLVLTLLFAFGTVYFFTAVEGTVWFAAMVIAAALQAFFLLCALDAERPLVAGLLIGCLYLTRPPACAAALLFAFEALRVSMRPPGSGERPFEWSDVGGWMRRVDLGALARRCVLFAVPIFAAFALVAWMNFTRYGRATPIYFDHELLAVGWRTRMAKWGGMFSYHFLAKNLGIALTSLPWLPPKGAEPSFGAPFKINEHGLALWFTTPLYLWLLWPKELRGPRKALYVVLAICAGIPTLMGLLYQNSGWRQFGYRFSNDYAILLFALLALGGRPLGRLFAAAGAWSVAWNLFGAATFDKAAYDRFYFRDGSQTIVYQPD